MHEHEGAQARPVWLFMVATAMATTVSTLAATAMVNSEAPEATQPTQVSCTCEAPAAIPVVAAPAAPPAPAEPIAAAPMPVQTAEPVVASEGAPAPKAEVVGSLDKDVIRRIVRAHIGEVRYCYNEGLAHDPELAGHVDVEFVIGAAGKVTRSVAHSEMEGEVPECIAKAVSRWMFPRPSDGGDVAVTYPFVLEPG